MPLNDTFPKAVTFITGEWTTRDGSKRSGEAGTGFIVEVPEGHIGILYVVTAAHVVRRLTRSFVRVNLKAGGVYDLPVSDWKIHDSEDVALAPIALGSDQYEFRMIPISAFADKWDRAPNLGDRVYFLGLLAELSAMAHANVPMVRSGTIGALYQPNVPVEIGPETTILVTGHLIDCRSYAGFSGSPCFVQFHEIRMGTVSIPGVQAVGIGDTTLLLGLVVAHFDLMRKATLTGDLSNTAGGVETPINTGVGVVLPVERIREVLMTPELIRAAKNAQRQKRRNHRKEPRQIQFREKPTDHLQSVILKPL